MTIKKLDADLRAVALGNQEAADRIREAIKALCAERDRAKKIARNLLEAFEAHEAMLVAYRLGRPAINTKHIDTITRVKTHIATLTKEVDGE